MNAMMHISPSGMRGFAAASMGALFMPGEWYAALRKPAWNPPGWFLARSGRRSIR